ncbi:ubiquilin-1-like protein [Histomonas meleagridis]|uniref:ubiquilin-1-like protein n=1 Tax=Histomonas meleagridis TaxID=135588 RepID=UPI0035598EF7|nr:ubiquilin-1-like protein [Histomonas meleagridis]KAH0800565.1 ubiquilin-1-like protein [Histomonas meleagridis]
MLHLLIKDSQGIVGDVDIQSISTIFNLKEEISRLTKKSPDDCILIYQGAILVDVRTLQSYNIQTNSTLYVTYKQKEDKPTKDNHKKTDLKASPQGIFGELKNSPMMKSMIEYFQNNPQIYMDILKSNPEFQKIAESNPQIQHALNDPDMLKEQLGSLLNPDAGNENAHTFDRMMDLVESLPGGFQALNHTINEFDPVLDGLQNQLSLSPKIPTKLTKEKPDKPSEDPLPSISMGNNNNFQNPNMLFGKGLDLFGLPRPLQPQLPPKKLEETPPNDSSADLVVSGISKCIENRFNIIELPGMELLKELYGELSPEAKYKNELMQLEGMGFRNKDRNIKALTESNGDLYLAIDYLVSNYE